MLKTTFWNNDTGVFVALSYWHIYLGIISLDEKDKDMQSLLLLIMIFFLNKPNIYKARINLKI